MNFTILFIVAEFVAVTFAFGLLYKLIGQRVTVYIQRNFGWAGYCVFGSVGVTYHELSHLTIWTPVVALIAIFVCPYMHMSLADIKGAISGALAFILVAFAVSLATAIIPIDTMIQ